MPKQNYAEKLALENIIYPVIGRSKATFIHANYELSLPGGSTRFIDFAIIGSNIRIAIEIDGYSYHAEGMIDRKAFDDQLSRQNEIVLLGWKILRFSFNQINNFPNICQDQLRRLLISDIELHPSFSKNLEPSQLQVEVLEKIENSRNSGSVKGLVCMPTGTGKTILSALDAKKVGGRTLFVAHNNHILKQAEIAYKKIFGCVSTGIINSEIQIKGRNEQIIFANIASIRTLEVLKEFKNNEFDYLVVDEFHHAAANSYQNFIKYFRPKFTLGLTATPERTDGKSILDLLDGNLICSISVSEAIERGFIVPFSYYGMFDNIDYANIHHNGYRYDINDLEKALLIPRRNDAILNIFKELVGDKLAIGFCVSIEHAEKMAEFFESNGIRSIAIHSNLNQQERYRRIALFERKMIQVVFVRDLFNEGVDFPDTQAILFLRPTESKMIFLQQLGRGLRLAPNKSNILVLDFIGNYFGSSEIPRLIRDTAGNQSDDGRLAKPEYVYDNGCQIVFSKEVIEHLEYADFKILDKVKTIERIVSLYERNNRPLNPLDLYLDLKEEFGLCIRTFGSYKNLTERLNTIEKDLVIIDMNFKGYDSEENLGHDDNFEFMVSQSMQISQGLMNIFKLIEKKSSTDISYVVIHLNKIMNGLFKNIGSLCLLRSIVKSYAIGELSINLNPELDEKAGLERQVNIFFARLSKASAIRNSYGICNNLKIKYPWIRQLVAHSLLKDNDYSYLDFASAIMDYEILYWIKDLYILTDPDILDF